MNYELSILKHFLIYSNWEKYKDKLNVKDLPKELIPVYSVLDNFHQNNKIDLTIADLANLLLSQQHANQDYYKSVLDTLNSIDASAASTEVLINSILKTKQLKEIALAAYDLTEGRGNEEQFRLMIQSLENNSPVVEEEFEFITDDVEELLNVTYRKPGLRWRLNTLNQMLGSLRPGDFGFTFARPETGKTTFLASETTYMAQQLSETDGPVIWFNNEEQHEKVKVRSVQATLGASLVQINANPSEATKAYLKATKGKHKILKVAGPLTKTLIEKVVQKHKPSLVVYDQIDKIQGFAADREDLLLGAIYQWARELAKSAGHATIAVCQADGSGEGQKWLTMANVANAKTAKQAEADWILGIGKTADVGYEFVRYLHLSKNKLSGDEDSDPSLRHGKLEVLIKPEIARYADIM